MLNINIKSEEPLKILKTISGSSLGLYLLNFAKEVPQISHETVPLKERLTRLDLPRSSMGDEALVVT
jgi:hypothetical protein